MLRFLQICGLTHGRGGWQIAVIGSFGYVCGCGSSSKGAKFNGDTGDMQHAVTLRVCLAVRQLGHSG